MLSITIICVGKLKENYYVSAFSEYEKRLKPYCKFKLVELSEIKLSQSPSKAEIQSALSKESELISKNISSGSYTISMCIEGNEMSSEQLSAKIQKCAISGKSKINFVIGSSYGLSDQIKSQSNLKLSMSKMTFPHHLARVMLAEQIYRAMMINEGSKYHK